MPIRLSTHRLQQITTATAPAYNRRSISRGIVHLGIGGFHRAHQALYTDELLASGDHRWGITGVSLRSSAVRDALAPQDYLYTVQTLGEKDNSRRIIGSVLATLALPEPGHLAQTLSLLAHADTQLVSLTITEKGYGATQKGELDTSHQDITHDLNSPQLPRSAPGLLALGLNRRMHAGGGPITILSCDNLTSNGEVTKNVVTEMACALNPELGAWLADHVSFPASMVDRIVPNTGDAEIAAFEAKAGYQDLALTRAEPFSQWVIENNFKGERPAWDIAGAQFVTEVAPFERAKLQLLNAAHSTLAYLGLLAGYDYVHEAIADPTLLGFVRHLLDDEITPEVTCPDGMNLTDYKASILSRFANPAVPYKTLQVASDGSLKLPQRLFPTIEARLKRQSSIAGLSLVVAGWIQCLAGKADNRANISVSDPAAMDISRLAAQHSSAIDLVQAIAQQTTYFGELGQSQLFLKRSSEALIRLRRDGSLVAAQHLTG